MTGRIYVNIACSGLEQTAERWSSFRVNGRPLFSISSAKCITPVATILASCWMSRELAKLFSSIHFQHFLSFVLPFYAQHFTNLISQLKKEQNFAVHFSAQFPQHFYTFFSFLSPITVRKSYGKMDGRICVEFLLLFLLGILFVHFFTLLNTLKLHSKGKITAKLIFIVLTLTFYRF